MNLILSEVQFFMLFAKTTSKLYFPFKVDVVGENLSNKNKEK